MSNWPPPVKDRFPLRIITVGAGQQGTGSGAGAIPYLGEKGANGYYGTAHPLGLPLSVVTALWYAQYMTIQGNLTLSGTEAPGPISFYFYENNYSKYRLSRPMPIQQVVATGEYLYWGQDVFGASWSTTAFGSTTTYIPEAYVTCGAPFGAVYLNQSDGLYYPGININVAAQPVQFAAPFDSPVLLYAGSDNGARTITAATGTLVFGSTGYSKIFPLFGPTPPAGATPPSYSGNLTFTFYPYT